MEHITHDIRVVSIELSDPHNNRPAIVSTPENGFANIRAVLGDERFEQSHKETIAEITRNLDQIQILRRLTKANAARTATNPEPPDNWRDLVSWRHRPKSFLEWLFS